MPSVGTPVSNSPVATCGASSVYTDEGPPERITALGLSAAISAAVAVDGTISLKTLHSRTRRAMSCAYCAPQSTTTTMSKFSRGALTSPSQPDNECVKSNENRTRSQDVSAETTLPGAAASG